MEQKEKSIFSLSSYNLGETNHDLHSFTPEIIKFILETKYEQIPAHIIKVATRSFLDTVGVAISSVRTKCSQAIYSFVKNNFGGKGGHLVLDDIEVSLLGSALAHSIGIDSIDIHDGNNMLPIGDELCSCRGHLSVQLVSSLLAFLNDDYLGKLDGKELLTCLVIGMEIGYRASVYLHSTAKDFHASGTWGCIGAAALSSRILNLSSEETRHALGIAEFYSPRAQMIRVVTYPSMVKGGCGWGAMVGISAALMAKEGFTGAPAITIEGIRALPLFEDLGKKWICAGNYYKPYGACRWAHPAIEAALKLKKENNIDPKQIEKIQVHTFYRATKLITVHPKTTDEAQFSLPFPVASALVHEKLLIPQISGEALEDPLINDLSEKVELILDEEITKMVKYTARVVIETKNTDKFDSGNIPLKWDPDTAPTDKELQEKFVALIEDQLSEERIKELLDILWNLESFNNLEKLKDLLFKKAEKNFVFIK